VRDATEDHIKRDALQAHDFVVGAMRDSYVNGDERGVNKLNMNVRKLKRL
jgi:hypothetical protein